MVRFLLLWLFSQSSFCMVYAQKMLNRKLLYEVNPKLDFPILSEMTTKEVYFHGVSNYKDKATLNALEQKRDILNKVHSYLIKYYTDIIKHPFTEIIANCTTTKLKIETIV